MERPRGERLEMERLRGELKLKAGNREAKRG